MVVLLERPSAQPGLGVGQEHVLEVLVCQHGHLHPERRSGRTTMLPLNHVAIQNMAKNGFKPLAMHFI